MPQLELRYMRHVGACAQRTEVLLDQQLNLYVIIDVFGALHASLHD